MNPRVCSRRIGRLALSNVQYHYKTRNELVEGLLSVYLDDFKAMIGGRSVAGKADLHALVRDLLAEEADSDEIRFSIALTSFAEQSEVAQGFENFYGQFYTELTDFLSQVSGVDAETVAINEAASLLLPLINGYGLVSKSLGMSPAELADEMAELLWDLITSGE